MFKKVRGLILICILMLLFTACTILDGSKASLDHPNIRGIITNIHRDASGNILSILVEGEATKETDYDKATISFREETTILENDENITSDDLFIGLTVEAWLMGPVAESYPIQAAAEKIKVINIEQKVTLDFSPIKPEILKPGKPEDSWLLEGLIDFSWQYDDRILEVYLYRRDFEEDPLGHEIFAFLQDENDMYEIGLVANYGIRSLGIELDDVTHNGNKEIILEGSLGATYVETKIIGQDHEGNWVLWLSGGSYNHIDLDGNGQMEWVATSSGSLPPYVVIYRWNGESFEWADVSAAVGGNYANLIQKNNEWILESGMWKLDHYANEFVINKRSYVFREDYLINGFDN
ncbi:DUF3221 domain-containing protein [Alkaliphilus transvaalensis]|uniref:DUF3221 domain-containing protein n=1 Tax=Alkaliphilus transvaalensis TaxID=114628 RepID=UPI000553F7F1|nr:DUF3221 domain-containing protein [Alkaliphilus transvaalensis]